MKIKDLYSKEKTVLSFEVFPPKRDGGQEKKDTIYKTLGALKELGPDFISVTYGAGGNPADKSTVELASHIKNNLGIETVAHLTCLNSTKNDLTTVLESFSEAGIDNILALRGDRNPTVPPKTDFRYASELIGFVRSAGYDFGISAACYPEGHIESPGIVDDIKNLRKKVNAGAETLVTQLFFENELFYDFREKLALADIDVPVSAGIMPVTNKRQIERMVSLCGASLPKKFTRMISRYEDKPEALVDAGIAYAVSQIADLTANGVDGIHIYTMNNPLIAKKIYENIRSLLG